MQLDPAGSDESSPSDITSSDIPSFEADALLVRADDPAARPAKEGLPKRFRMRHGRHYVDELLGDAPLRTVREIPVSEIEPPLDEPINLDALEESVRALGVVEPLLVARRGVDYRVIAGMRRLRAARTVGLSTVPCLVQDVDDAKYESLRAAVVERMTVPLRTRVEHAPDETIEGDAAADQASDQIALGRGTVSASLRAIVDAEIESVEQLRAAIASAAADTLARPLAIERLPASCADVIADAVAAVAVEARLRGVRVDATRVAACRMPLDAARWRAALTGLLQCQLEASRPGSALDVRAELTTIRPALIIECGLHDAPALTDRAIARYFDADVADHPSGSAGSTLLAALAKTAKAHGGRVQAHSSGAVTAVIPKPIGVHSTRCRRAACLAGSLLGSTRVSVTRHLGTISFQS